MCKPRGEIMENVLYEYADTLFGVGSATSAGPAIPSGSIHPSPETLEADCGGYLRNQPIVGFGQAYTSGAGGKKCYGNFLVCPVVDTIETDREKRASFAVLGTEKGRCYEYSVQLENGIKINVTPSKNSAIYEFEFPSGKQGGIFVDICHKLDVDACIKDGFVNVNPKGKSMCGGGLCTGNWNGKDWNMYFSAQFDTDFCEMGLVKDLELVCESDEKRIEFHDFERWGVYVKFPINDKPLKVRFKIAISFVSAEKAGKFLGEQIPAFDYDKVKAEAKTAWNEVFSAIDLETDDKSLLRRFYTAMYHMNLQPVNRTNDHGLWDDFHTIWDSWKTVFPMYCLLYPDKMATIVDSFIDRYYYNKEVGNGIVLGDEFCAKNECVAGQGGNDIDNVISDCYLKGIQLKKHTWEDGYKVLLASAENMRSKEYIEKGYASDNKTTVSGVPYTWRFRAAAATQGFAANDKAVSRVAKELGTKEEYERYEKRSANWLNIWNKDIESEGFYGFPQTRNDDGSFDGGFDAHGGYNTNFYEATGWDASYINYNDSSRLVEIMGGPEIFEKRLLWACEHSKNYFNDDGGAEGYLNFTNEPSFHIPWLFCIDEIRRPDLAAKVIDTIIARFSVLDDYPGDEDNGGMSSYYLFLMCGFFPYATTRNYYLHGTRVEKITFRLGSGKEFIVTGENVGKDNIYVQRATWQGKEYNSCKMTHSQILEGGELHFFMGDKPSDWARK